MKKVKYVTRYQVITSDLKIVVKRGFLTWEEAHDWALTHDWGQYAEHGGLYASPFTARAD